MTTDCSDYQKYGHVKSLLTPNVSAIKQALMDEKINLVLIPFDDSHTLPLLSQENDHLSSEFQFWQIKESYKALKNNLDQKISDLGLKNKRLTDRLVAEVVELTNLFVTVTGDLSPFVSFRSISTSYFTEGKASVSSHFHRDSATVTLFKVFYGKGTEWTPNSNVVRKTFKSESIQDLSKPENAYVHDDSLVYPTDSKCIGFLKGELDRDNLDERSLEFVENFISRDEIPSYNIGNSLIHRGPMPSLNEKRLLLTVTSFRLPKL